MTFLHFINVAVNIEYSLGFFTVGEVAKELCVSKSRAYVINKELCEIGIIIQVRRGIYRVNKNSPFISAIHALVERKAML